jgi:hypothetical protein
MKNILKYCKVLAMLALAGALFASCVREDGPKVAKAVLGDQSIMNFAARNPQAQTVTVYSDGPWHTKAPDWITVDPAEGDGVVVVTVTAAENADAGGLLEPRKDTLFISGNTLASRLIILVNQEGDTYRFAEHQTLDKILELKDGKSFILDEATVAAVTAAGAVLTDGTSLIYTVTGAETQVGDKVTVKGVKSTVNGVPTITQADEFTVNSSGTFAPGEPADFNVSIASYQGGMEYVKVSGVVSGGSLKVEVDGVEYAVKQVDCQESLGIGKLTGNKVELTGYTYGVLGANMFGILTTEMKDNGPAIVPRPDKLLYAKWRFTGTTMTGYQDLFGGTAGVTDLTEGFSELYVPSNVAGPGKITYYQVDKTGTTPTSGNPKRIVGGTGHPYVTGAWPGDYWLFSATDGYEYPAGTNLHIKYLTRISGTGQKYWMLEYFDGAEWKPADEYPVESEGETGTNAQYNFINPTSNVAVECYWRLAAPCREPMFRMRCVANWQSNGSGALANPNGGTCRIADNGDDGEDAGPVFEVTDAPEGDSGVPAGMTVFEDDFEWLAPYTQSGVGDDLANNTVNTDTAPNVFTVEALAPCLAEFMSRGYGYIWGWSGQPWSDGTPDNGNKRTLYLQKNYLKFGKSKYNSGIILPALSALPAAGNVDLTFNWCSCMTGNAAPDMTSLVVVVTGGAVCADSGADTSSEIVTTQPIKEDGTTDLVWQTATVSIKGATQETRITIRPANYDPDVTNSARHQNRWYLDNIKVVTAK